MLAQAYGGQYDPFRGSIDQVRQRMMSAEVFTEPHYKGGTGVLLQLALTVMADEGRPATSLWEVLQTLADRERMVQLAAREPLAAAVLEHIDPRAYSGTVQRYAFAAIELAKWTAPQALGGWSFEDADVIHMDLPTATEKGSATMLLRWVLTDLQAYLAGPRRLRDAEGNPRPLLLTLEEFSALDRDPIVGQVSVDLAERARSARGRVIIVAQDPMGLGDEQTRSRLLTNGMNVVFRQVTGADDLAKHAGTVEVPEGSVTYAGRGGLSVEDEGRVSSRERPKVHPNELRTLDTGECFIIHGGRAAKLRVALNGGHYGTRPVPEWVTEQAQWQTGTAAPATRSDAGVTAELPTAAEEQY